MSNQLEFLNNFVQLFGFKSLQDYETQIYCGQYKDDKELLQKINNEIPNIKKYYPFYRFTIKRNNNKIVDFTMALTVLKTCLKLSKIPYELIRTNKYVFIKLVAIA